MKGISVIVCCYNSADRISDTLKYISQQKVDKNIKWEVIIVDNNSQDDTSKIAKLSWDAFKKHEIEFKIVLQPIAGLSNARQKGTEVSTYENIIFCDDDNWLFENYVQEAYFSIDSSTKIGIIGGCGIARPEISPPEWFNQFSSFYAIGPQYIDDKNIQNATYVYGAGMIVKKSIFQKIANLNIDFLATDRINNKLSSGGDVELCYIANLLNFQITYDNRLKFYHFIESKRLTLDYIKNLVFQFGYCNVLHRPYYWIFNPLLSAYKKNWVWVVLISVNIFLISLIKKYRSPDFLYTINLHHAKGRLVASLKLNYRINSNYKKLKNKFKL